MTHFAGVFAKRDDVRPEAFAGELKRHLSRFPGERIGEFASEHCYLCHFDLTGDPDADWVDEPDRLTIVCGAPLVATGQDRNARDKPELARLLAAGTNGLRGARGVFCGVAVDRGRGELTLFTDRLGIRPVYVYENERFIAFASALRILTACSFCPTEIDLIGAVQTASFGGGLGARTAFARICAARPAEVIRVTRNGSSSSFYWRWDEIEPRHEWPESGAADLYELFREAVALRRTGPEEHAFLSGGMDSRAIVAMLQALGAEPRTYSFSPPGLLDGPLSEQYAAAAGVRYTHRPHYRMVVPEVQAFMARELRALAGADAVLPPAWSGDGGSVGFGHVYFEETAIEALRAGEIEEAIRRFLAYSRFGVPIGIFTAATRPRVQPALSDAIREEVLGYAPAVRDRWLFLFMLCNEQRTHLSAHFEELDLHRVELVLPFFDWEFLAYICSLPIDDCLWHRAYAKFFELLPPSVRAVPWQTYPGHVPCPLSLPIGAVPQWEIRPHWRLRMGQRVQSLQVLRYALSRNFPATLLDRTGVSLRALADLGGLSNRNFEMKPVALLADAARLGRTVVLAEEH